MSQDPNIHSNVIKKLQQELSKAGSSATKTWWERYMKHVIKFYGLKMQQIRQISNQWFDKHIASQSVSTQKEIVFSLFKLPIAEEKLAGVLLLQNKLLNDITPDDINIIESFFDNGYIYDWNVCDWFCMRVLHPLTTNTSNTNNQSNSKPKQKPKSISNQTRSKKKNKSNNTTKTKTKTKGKNSENEKTSEKTDEGKEKSDADEEKNSKPNEFAVKIMNWVIKPEKNKKPVLWKSRAACVTFVNIGNFADNKGESGNWTSFAPDMIKMCQQCMDDLSNERFMQTGIGWLLREVAIANNQCKILVIKFVNDNLHLLTKEALQSIVKKMNNNDKKQLLAKYQGQKKVQQDDIKSRMKRKRHFSQI